MGRHWKGRMRDCVQTSVCCTIQRVPDGATVHCSVLEYYIRRNASMINSTSSDNDKVVL